MESLGGTSRAKVRDFQASIAQAQVTSSSESILMDNQDSDNNSNEAASGAMSAIQVTQNDVDSKIASTSTPVDNSQCDILEDELSERLSRLPQKYLNRYMDLQNNSSFWTNLFCQPPTTTNNHKTDATGSYYSNPPLKSRDWAKFVVDASRIFFEARLPVSEVVSIINYTIQWVTVGFLDGGDGKTIYFEDGRNVFYEPRSGGMMELQKRKYEEFLGKMRETILGGRDETRSDSEMEVISDSGDESSPDVSEASQMEDAFTPAEDAVMITSQEGRQGITDILPWELSTTPTEVKPSTLNTVKNSDSQAQTTKNPPQTNQERKRKRQNVKRNERRKRSLSRMRKLLSESKDTTKSKADKRRRWRKNRRMKKIVGSLQGCKISA